jgi:nitrogen regulatory protein PII
MLNETDNSRLTNNDSRGSDRHAAGNGGLHDQPTFSDTILILILLVLLQVVETIARTARTGSIGDGKIIVSDISSVARIMADELGGKARCDDVLSDSGSPFV